MTTATTLENPGWQKVMVNLRNLALRSVTSCQLHVCSAGPQRAVIDVTYTAACSHTARTVHISGFWLSSNQLPHWVTMLNQHNHPSRKNPAGLMWHLAGSWSLWSVRGYPVIQRGEQRFVAWPLHDQTEIKRVGLALEPWQSERCVVWPLLFTGLG